MQTSKIFDIKNLRYFENYGLSVQTRGKGVETVWTFFEKGGTVNFCEQLLWKAPKENYLGVELQFLRIYLMPN